MPDKILLPDNPRILVTRADRLGDLVISTAVFPELRKKFPRAWIAALSFTENRAVLEGNPSLDQVLLYDKKGSEKGIFGNLFFARRLAALHFDIVIHLHATNRMHVTAWLARIPRRIGWDRRLTWTLTHVFHDHKSEGKKHEGEYNFELLEALGISAPETLQTFFPVSEKARASVDFLLKKLDVPKDFPWVVLAPGASCPSKRWPVERFGYLADRIAEKYKVRFLAIGSAADRELVEKLKANCKVPVTDLTGRLNLEMLGAFLKEASLFVSNDSGPVHVASAVRTPVVSIFGRRLPGLSPVRWRPLGLESRVAWKDVGCDPCLAHDCRIDFLCQQAVLVEDVLKEVDFFAERLKAGEEVYS